MLTTRIPRPEALDKDGSGGAGPGDLPVWDLTDLYPGPDSPELKAALVEVQNAARDFADRNRGKVASLDGKAFGAAIAEYEKICEVLYRILSYGQLLHSGNVSDPEIGRFYQGLNEKGTEISTETLFFTLEINRLDDGRLAEMMADPAAAHYAPWVRDVRLFKDHQLSDDLEKLMHEKDITGAQSWVRLFDETMAALRFPIDGKDLTITEAMTMLSDRDGAVRKTAAKALGKVLGDNIRLFGLITNTLAKDKELEDKWRRYPHPMASRNLANQVEDAVVEALVSAVKDSYPRLSHRYYALKAKWFGVDKLDYWDRNAPLPEDDDRRWTWDEATSLVMDAYHRFSPALGEVGKRFFDNAWIDVPARPGKASGAFAHPTVPSVHPYLMLNFMGRGRDVMTLAHELGHGVHQVLAGKQGTLMSNTPLTLAETASVFGEMLTFRAMVDAAPDAKSRRVMLASKVEDMLNTVVRQIAFHEFERQVHAERRDGELSAERLGEIWMGVQTSSLGPAFRYDDEYATYWAYIPHFVHSPFYVYAYAFGDCLVNSLYRVYEQGEPGFQDKYMEMLRAGGTLRHRELLEPFGLDASDPGFWKKGLSVVEGFIDELEKEV
ncbi:M3 family oligoendopeptidase [Novispirillum sp. DQ9]|uniref:M3 family oligoendopeptidase n=1 Tax=Novispirillum sp. DQ9 TaxID=3398612 RepID=UPI003C7DFCF8